jgi:hypothetical protein
LFGDAAAALDRCELVVVQHLFMTDSADFADVVLPTTAFGEERVTFTSTERRIQIAERVIDPPEGPMPAWEQLTRLARAMGAPWKYESAADVMQEIGEVVPFYSGASHENLARDYGRQWPCTTDRPLGTRAPVCRRGNGRPFKFVPVARRPSRPAIRTIIPFTLVFGIRFTTGTKTSSSSTAKPSSANTACCCWIIRTASSRSTPTTPSASASATAEASAQHRRRLADLHRAGHAEVRSGTAFVPYFVRQLKREMLGATGDGAVARAGARGKGGGMKARIVARRTCSEDRGPAPRSGYEVIAPFCGRGRDSYFDTVTDANRAGADSFAQSVLSAQALRLSAHRAVDESAERTAT